MTKYIIIAVALLSGALGFYAAKKLVKPVVVTQVKEIEKVVTKTVTKERIVTKNGTTIERETVADKAEDRNTNKPLPIVAAVKPQWSLELNWGRGSYVPVEASVGRRILGDLWLTAGSNWKHDPYLLIGIRYEF